MEEIAYLLPDFFRKLIEDSLAVIPGLFPFIPGLPSYLLAGVDLKGLKKQLVLTTVGLRVYDRPRRGISLLGLR